MTYTETYLLGGGLSINPTTRIEAVEFDMSQRFACGQITTVGEHSGIIKFLVEFNVHNTVARTVIYSRIQITPEAAAKLCRELDFLLRTSRSEHPILWP